MAESRLSLLKGADSWVGAVFATVAAVGLAAAIQDSNGAYSASAFSLLWQSSAALLLAFVVSRRPWKPAWGKVLAGTAVGLGLLWELTTDANNAPAIYLTNYAGQYPTHHLFVIASAIAAGIGLFSSGRTAFVAIALLCVSQVAAGVWLVKASPSPIIDVVTWHAAAFEALRNGINPYAISIPNIYHSTQWYTPDFATAETVYAGYLYPPLSLILGFIADALSGDFRSLQVLAMPAAGALMGLSRKGEPNAGIAALFMCAPRNLFVLEQGWTEGHVIFFFALVVFTAGRAPKFLALALGIAFASKQYLAFAAPAAYLLVDGWKSWLRLMLRAGIVAALFTVPPLFFGPKEYFHSLVGFQGAQPFRSDSLSFLAHRAQLGLEAWPLWLGFALMVPVWVCSVLFGSRSPAGFALASAMTFFVFFAFGKQAFCNYYFFVFGVLCSAVGAMALHPPERSRETEP